MAPSALPSKRCFLCDLATRTFVANSRETVRLLGVAVNLEAAVDEVVYPGHQNCWDNSSGVGPIGPSSSDYRNLMLLTLDDGTGESFFALQHQYFAPPSFCLDSHQCACYCNKAVADIFIPDYMIQKLEVRPGHTLECIALLRQRGSTKKWYANSLSRVTDPHVEILVSGDDSCRTLF